MTDRSDALPPRPRLKTNMAKTTRLLLIDDEPALLRLMQTYLTRLGYEVEAIGDGTRAWQRYRENATAYDLVITDLTMPDLAVESVLPQMPDFNRAIRVLICSGKPFEVRALPRGIREHFSFLQKPFVPKMLADAVADTLNRRLSATA
jgi:DNA-binding NtrC family response regulator